ncbi:hypothetical protein MRB53_039589 [Persea americana]|nr:hypothetical protein MRB53_039589 [Persea americana]
MNQLRDFPPVSGAIRWAQQLSAQLDLYMEKVQAVLGEGWQLYTEGQQLQADSNALRDKLNTQSIFERWLSEVKERDYSITGQILDVLNHRAFHNKLDLTVLFDTTAIVLFKETRNLSFLGFNIPHQVNNTAKLTKAIYPFAVSLTNSVSVLSQIQPSLEDLHDDTIVMAKLNNDVQEHILSSLEVILARNAIGQSMLDLHECDYSEASMRAVVQSIQDVVNSIVLKGFSNISTWIQQLNTRIESILTIRLQHALEAWIAAFDDTKP